jgi:aryl-alcohol dehydrogenase-like predicted oxidoreductase
MSSTAETNISRRSVLAVAGVLAAGQLVSGAYAQTTSTSGATALGAVAAGQIPRRMLGALEVSAIGIGVQNMSRTYQTTIPDRTEMINIIRTAHERGVTLFDAVEAYGPWEVERILGEAVEPFRDEIVIETKFGWNIDQQTGGRLQGTNSRPEQIKLVVDNMLKRLRTDRIDLLYQHRVDAAVPIEDVAGAIKT